MGRTAIYAGSFDPVTFGHIDIIKRATRMVDHVIVGVAKNPEKNTLFSVTQRLEFVQTVFKDTPTVSVIQFDGLLVDLAQKKNISLLIRGLRAMSDFEYEFQMALTNRFLDKKIETMFLMTDVNYSYLSSSIVKQLARLKADVSKVVPAHVVLALEGAYHG